MTHVKKLSGPEQIKCTWGNLIALYENFKISNFLNDDKRMKDEKEENVT